MTELTQIKQELEAIKSTLLKMEKNGLILGDYIPEKLVATFFNYSETKLREFRRQNKVIFSKIGVRYFYSIESIIKLLNDNKINTDGKIN
jgi:hypothetical protein